MQSRLQVISNEANSTSTLCDTDGSALPQQRYYINMYLLLIDAVYYNVISFEYVSQLQLSVTMVK